MVSLTRRGIQEMATPIVLGVYVLTGVTFNGIASFSFNHWDYSLTSALAEPAGIAISVAGLIGLVVPAAVYFINNNYPRQIDSQSFLALFPTIAVGLMIISPPLKDFVLGTMWAGVGLFLVETIIVALVAGPNDLPEIPVLSEVTG